MNTERKNILIVGEEQTGKTTLVKKIIDEIGHKQGFITRESTKVDGKFERVTYNLVPIHDQEYIEKESGIEMGSIKFNRKGGAEYTEADFSTLKPIFRRLRNTNGHFLFADEISLMDGLVSDVEFYKLVNAYLASPNLMLGTISPQNEGTPSYYFVENVLHRPDAVVFDLGKNSVDEVENMVRESIHPRYFL